MSTRIGVVIRIGAAPWLSVTSRFGTLRRVAIEPGTSALHPSTGEQFDAAVCAWPDDAAELSPCRRRDGPRHARPARLSIERRTLSVGDGDVSRSGFLRAIASIAWRPKARTLCPARPDGSRAARTPRPLAGRRGTSRPLLYAAFARRIKQPALDISTIASAITTRCWWMPSTAGRFSASPSTPQLFYDTGAVAPAAGALSGLHAQGFRCRHPCPHGEPSAGPVGCREGEAKEHVPSSHSRRRWVREAAVPTEPFTVP